MAATKLADLTVSIVDAQQGLMTVFEALIGLGILVLGATLILEKIGLIGVQAKREAYIKAETKRNKLRYKEKDPYGRYYSSYRSAGMNWNEINRLREIDNKKASKADKAEKKAKKPAKTKAKKVAEPAYIHSSDKSSSSNAGSSHPAFSDVPIFDYEG